MRRFYRISLIVFMAMLLLQTSNLSARKKRRARGIDPNIPIGMQALPQAWLNLDPFNFDEKGWYRGSYVLTQDNERSEPRPSLYIMNVLVYSYSITKKRREYANNFNEIYNVVEDMGNSGYDFIVSPTTHIQDVEVYTNNETKIEGYITLYAVNIGRYDQDVQDRRAGEYAHRLGESSVISINTKRLGRKDFNESVELLRYAFEERMNIEDITNYESSDGKVFFEITKSNSGDEATGLVAFYQDNGATGQQITEFLKDEQAKYKKAFKNVGKRRKR